MRVLGLVPARAGSKGIPGKNIKPLGNKPLLAYTAEAASAAGYLTRAVLSTEDEEIANVGREYGLEVPFMRPSSLASDHTPTLAVVRHVLEQLAAHGERYDAICLLQPTSPFRGDHEIDSCIDLLRSSGADCALTISRTPAEYHPQWAYVMDNHGRLGLLSAGDEPPPRRQDLPPVYHRTGSVYVSRVEAIESHDSLYGDHVVGFEVDSRTSVNLDTPSDWKRAEALLRT